MQAGLMNTYQRPIPALGMRWDVFQAGAEAVGLKSKWTLYGLLYTLAMIAGGAYVIRRHGSSRYQLIRTSVVVLVQITFGRSEEHTSELQSRENLVCRLLLEKKKQ